MGKKLNWKDHWIWLVLLVAVIIVVWTIAIAGTVDAKMQDPCGTCNLSHTNLTNHPVPYWLDVREPQSFIQNPRDGKCGEGCPDSRWCGLFWSVTYLSNQHHALSYTRWNAQKGIYEPFGPVTWHDPADGEEMTLTLHWEIPCGTPLKEVQLSCVNMQGGPSRWTPLFSLAAQCGACQ